MSVEPNFGAPSASVTPTTPDPKTQAVAPEATKQDASLSDVGAPVGAKSDASAVKQVEALEKKAESGEKLTQKEQKVLKEYRLKINGRDEVIKFDPFNDDEVVKHLQKSRASDQKFQEAAEVRKAAMEFIDQLRKNPKRVLSDPNIGIDVKRFAEEILNEEIKEMEKSPEQREREKLQRELEDLKQQAKQREEQTKQDQFQRMQAEQERILESEITSALDIGGMPKTPRTVKAMAEMMMIALENGIDLSPKDIAPIVKNTTLSEFKEVVNSLTDDQLEDFLGKEVIGRLRKKNIAKVKAIQTANTIKATGVSQAKKTESLGPVKKMSIKQFLKV